MAAFVGVVIYLAIIIVMIVGLWKIFTKAGKPGWACLIPIYNIIVLLDIAGKPAWWFILFLIPIVNLIIVIMTYLALAKAFGKSGGFAIGMLLLPFIFIPMLGFGDAQYQGATA
jgi:hypothetical protein